MICTLHHLGTGKDRKVRNLGWLIRHGRECSHVECWENPDGSGRMVATIGHGIPTMEFRAAFASFRILHTFARRQALAGATKCYHFQETKDVH